MASHGGKYSDFPLIFQQKYQQNGRFLDERAEAIWVQF